MKVLLLFQIVLICGLFYLCVVVSPTTAKSSEEDKAKDKSKKNEKTEVESEDDIIEITKKFNITEDGVHVIPATGISNKKEKQEYQFGQIFQGIVSALGGKRDLKELSIKFSLYTLKNKKVGQPITYETEASETHWDVNQNTVFLIHGYTPGPDDDLHNEGIKTSVNIRNAYFNSSRTENIVIVTWKSKPPPLNFLAPGKSISILGEVLGHMIVSLKVRKFLSYKQIKLVGFSLGAHIAGVAGHYLDDVLDIKLPQITGLDPSSNGYDEQTELKLRLDKTDADFVDVIHTSTLGTALDSGHVTFYPSHNGAGQQPGCELKDNTNYGLCSHLRAAQLYASTVRGREYKGCECHNVEKFNKGECSKCKGPFMGDLCPRNATGKYYLKATPEEEDII